MKLIVFPIERGEIVQALSCLPARLVAPKCLRIHPPVHPSVLRKATRYWTLPVTPCPLLSPPLQMDDGKSIRYKDLYALFEHILEKTMRQEQRGWRESPVTVWVNTFKVFLDEFMTEYKPMDSSTLSRVSTSIAVTQSGFYSGLTRKFELHQ